MEASCNIFYFSGTGNSYTVAKTLTSGIDDSVASAIKTLSDVPSITVNCEKVGFVFPAYFMRVPRIVERFVDKIESLQGTYVFAVVTVAGISGRVLHRFDELVRKRNGVLSAGFIVRMPPNYVDEGGLLPWFIVKPVLYLSRTKIGRIARYIDRSKKKRIESFNPLFTLLFKSAIEKNVTKGMFEPTDDRYFRVVQERCIQCDLCKRICPVGNITREGDDLFWNGKCEKCLACINWCPKQAIQYRNVTEKRGRYHHPAVSVREMVGE